ncbi:hypothetical protein NXT3_PA00156 (plasmid) [Sinorhizobium fredii]|uniref:Uncharacterized protein n=1 Tax=Rhizobium fredii TaxID=380 RepID=A0A2L0HAC3_RHIFR|nr:hypothetical protein NXT3_PA00156 [Sinorhizobium fredii]
MLTHSICDFKHEDAISPEEICGGTRTTAESRALQTGRSPSLRLVVVVGFGVEIALVADLELGDERKGDRDRIFNWPLWDRLAT